MEAIGKSLALGNMYRDAVSYFVPGFLFVVLFYVLEPGLSNNLSHRLDDFGGIGSAVILFALSYILGKLFRGFGSLIFALLRRALPPYRTGGYSLRRLLRSAEESIILKDTNEYTRLSTDRVRALEYKQDNPLVREVSERYTSTAIQYESLLGLAVVASPVLSWWFLLFVLYLFLVLLRAKRNSRKFEGRIRGYMQGKRP